MPDKLFPEIRQEEVDTFIESGKDGPRRIKEIKSILNYFYQNAAFKEAMESDFGKEFLKDAVRRMSELHQKLIRHEETEKERSEFDGLVMITEALSSRIQGYLNRVEIVKGNK